MVPVSNCWCVRPEPQAPLHREGLCGRKRKSQNLYTHIHTPLSCPLNTHSKHSRLTLGISVSINGDVASLSQLDAQVCLWSALSQPPTSVYWGDIPLPSTSPESHALLHPNCRWWPQEEPQTRSLLAPKSRAFVSLNPGEPGLSVLMCKIRCKRGEKLTFSWGPWGLWLLKSWDPPDREGDGFVGA